ncbi:tape measure protein [Candidatus Saccharibacteria bacterium]|nr:tape measure protein [Candidatus Saccharibacteria bacterium]
MAGKIKGITIEYSGNTTKLEAALQRVKNSTSAINRELRNVNTALKFNPHNSELLAQKQQLLKQKIDGTKQSLRDLKNIQSQLDSKNVSKTSAEYQKVRRSIIEAESKIRTFNAQLARSKFQGMTNLGKGLQNVGQKLTNATRYARRFALALGAIALYKGFQRLKSLDETETSMKALGYRGEELKGIMDATSQSVDGTRFMLQDMAKVATGALGSGVTEKYKLNDYLSRTADLAQLTGMDVTEMGAIMNKAYSKGRVDARLLNQFNARGIPIYKLLQRQLGVTADELTKMTRAGEIGFDDLYKATDRYDGLAQKMGTETLSGAATVLTQQFGLIGAEFLEGVYEPIKTGVQGLVSSIKSLRKSGTFKAWGEALGQTVKYFIDWFTKGEASMDGLSTGAKNMITALSPIVTTIGSIVQAFAKLPPQVQGLVGAFALFGGPMMTGVGKMTVGLSNLGANLATMKMNAAAGVGPVAKLATALGTTAGPLAVASAGFLALGGWVAAIVIEYNKAKKAQTQYTDSVKEWEESQAGKIQAIKDGSTETTIYMNKLNQLMGKEKKTATDKAMIKQYVDKLNGSIDGLNLKYDEEKDKLNKTTQAIKDKIEAQKQSAIAAAYEEKVTEGAKKLLELKEKQKKLEKERTTIQKTYNGISNKTAAVTATYKRQLSEVNGKIKDNKKAQKEMSNSIDQSAQAAANLAPKMQKQYNKIAKTAKNAGVKIPKNLKTGIEDGSIAIPQSMNQLYKAINPAFAKAVKRARKAGVDIPKGLQKKINEGKVKPAKAARTLSNAVDRELGKAPKKASNQGKKTGSSYGSGVGSKGNQNKAKKNGAKLKSAASKGANTKQNDKESSIYKAGGNFAAGFASGMIGGLPGIVSAAIKLYKGAKKALSKEQDDGSPAKKMIPHGKNFAWGYALGIEKNIGLVQRATDQMVSAALHDATVKVPAANITAEGIAASVGAEVQKGINVSLQNQQQPATNAVFNIQVSGGESPEQFADELVRDLKLKVRTI